MRGKTLLCCALTLLLVFSIVMLVPVNAQTTTIGVEPENLINPALTTFKVEIWVRNVVDLAGVEFKLGYNTTVLTATLIEYAGIFGPNYMEMANTIYDAAGWLIYSVMAGFDEPSFTGSGRVANITFTVALSAKGSILDLYDTKLGDSYIPPNAITHLIIDGFFNWIRGDVNCNGTVETNDLVKFRQAYGSKTGDSNWNGNADIDRFRNGFIDVNDLTICGKNYGRSV